MVNLAKLEYAALDITGKNYLTWVLDTKIHLEVGNLKDIIRKESNSSSQDRAKAMIFIRRHLDEALKSEYLTVEDPLALWKALRSRYNHQSTVILPRARYEWSHLRIQYFKSVAEYNSALFRITSQMKLFEQNNELLMKNHNSRPTGSASFPEVNVASLEVNATLFGGDYHKQGRGHKRGRWNRKGKNHGVQFHNQVLRHNSGPSFKNVNRHKGKAHMNNAPMNFEGACHRCGSNGHWARTCRIPKHLVELYQASLKEKGIETNFLDQAKPMDIPDPVLIYQGNWTQLT
ncbi:uncharacterized protein [Malus domestica]|uniref:uncharacterized protein n=1 Tax=Malus domestica TaxID=3750 RepID=UPI003976271D